MRRRSIESRPARRSAAALGPLLALFALAAALGVAASDFLGSPSAVTLLPPLPEPTAPSLAVAAGPADTLHYTVLMAGHPAGEERAIREPATARAPERWHIRFAFEDRGRGPELEAELLVDAATGLPVRLEVHGFDYLKSRVDESFGIWKEERPVAHPVYSSGDRSGDAADAYRGAEAVWLNQGEDDRKPLERPALYLPLNDMPTLRGIAARALQRAAEGCLELVPAGRACIEPVARASLDAGFGPRRDVTGGMGVEGASEPPPAEGASEPGREREVVLYAVSGLDFSPYYLWLDPDGTLFAAAGGRFQVVRAGWEEALEQLATWEERAEDDWLRELARTLPERPEGPLAIVNARLFDPWTLEVRPATTILVRGERILAVGRDGDVELPADARVVDAEGKTALPGLFDMHVHLSPVDGLLHLAAGVTTVRDLGNDPDRVRGLRRSFAEGTAIGPRVILAGILDGPGPFAGPTRALVDTEADAREWIDRYADFGYDQIKVYSSLRPALVPAIARAARDRGLRLSGHVPAFMTAEAAVDAGFEEIQHANMLVLNFLGDTLDTRTPLRLTVPGAKARELDLASDSVRAFIRLLAARDVAVDPTLALIELLLTGRAGEPARGFRQVAERLPPRARRGFVTGGLPVPDGADEAYRDSAYAASLGTMLELTAALHRADVRILPGTDALAGFALHRELELYERAGIPAPEVLRLATIGAARVAGRARELGSVEPGKLADLVLVDGEPERQISHVRRVMLVVKGGVLYEPARLYEAVGVRDSTLFR